MTSPTTRQSSKALSVETDHHQQIPKALLTAFNQPDKDKKPFTYFPGGDKPDLSAHPSPSAVRKSNSTSLPNNVPRVLPIVSQRDLEIQETSDKNRSRVSPAIDSTQEQAPTAETNHIDQNRSDKDEEMSTLTHAQYNSPMPLYSKQNVQDVVQQTHDFHGNRPQSAASGQFNPNQSGAYRLLQENGQIAPAHSARLDEQKDEYPHYRGFVDPRVQSPSFKRLQYVTGMDSGTEDEISHELHPPVKSRVDEPTRSPSRTSYVSSQAHEQHQSSQPPPASHEYKPQWVDDLGGPRVAQRDPDQYEHPQQQSIDPAFAARIAEAERPKVPPAHVPTWARKAEEKRNKWRQQGGGGDHQRSYEYQPPAANWEPHAHKVQDKWSAHFGTTRYDSYENQPRARSEEPYRAATTRRQDDRKEWLKPYVAPNVHTSRYGAAPTSQTSYSPSYRTRPSSYAAPEPYATSYASNPPPSRPYSSMSTTSSTYRQRSTTPYDYSATNKYQTASNSGYSTPKKEVNMSTLVSDEALARNPHETNTTVPWSKHAESKRTIWDTQRRSVDPDHSRRGGSSGSVGDPVPAWAQRAEQTHSLWQNEADAWRQRQHTGTDLSRRATSNGPSDGGQYGGGSDQHRFESRTTTTSSNTRGASPSWRQRPVPHEVSPYGGSNPGYTTSTTNPSFGGGSNPNYTSTYTTYSSPGGSREVSTRRTYKKTTTTSSSGGPVDQAPPPSSIDMAPAPLISHAPPPSSSGPIATGHRWQQAPGSETKSQSAGAYTDRDGNRVDYTKEVYTSSDPGKEYSMLTEQEKKILEEPMEPGVVSRHTTTKYYKKSTYTSSTSTNTSQSQPTTSTYHFPAQTTTTSSTSYH